VRVVDDSIVRLALGPWASWSCIESVLGWPRLTIYVEPMPVGRNME
jgi:hypothetical protein